MSEDFKPERGVRRVLHLSRENLAMVLSGAQIEDWRQFAVEEKLLAARERESSR
jgi:hypothetical protein